MISANLMKGLEDEIKKYIPLVRTQFSIYISETLQVLIHLKDPGFFRMWR